MNGSEPKAVLTIALMPDGNVAVNGPIQDRILCYGLLEAAHDAIHDFKPDQSQQIQVVPAMPSIIPPFKLKTN